MCSLQFRVVEAPKKKAVKKASRTGAYTLGWSEKPKSLKSKNGQADYLPRHSLDVRTVFEI